MDQKEKFKENLERLITQKSVMEIAENFGMSRQSIYKWLIKLNIDYKKDNRFKKGKSNFSKLNKIADKLLNQ